MQYPTGPKSVFLTAAMLLLAPVAFAADLTAADLTIEITSIPDIEGEVRWLVFDNAESYASGKNAVMSLSQRVNADTMRFTLHALPPGRYAVKMFHDQNGNGELDSNALGIPQEGYGFSNNGGRFGPPSFDDAAVPVDANSTITIRVR